MGKLEEQQAAARASIQYIEDGQVVGLGSGSTAAWMIRYLAERVRAEGLRIRGIPTSEASHQLATELGISLTTLEAVQQIDVTIDGADEFDPQLRLIKGGGGALLREKIVASASRKMVVVADAAKQVPVLGRFPLPVEVIRFAEPLIRARLAEQGGRPKLRMRASGEPFLTDEQNHILDCRFERIEDPESLARTLSDMPGVVEHGLFLSYASLVVMGAADGGVREFRR